MTASSEREPLLSPSSSDDVKAPRSGLDLSLRQKWLIMGGCSLATFLGVREGLNDYR